MKTINPETQENSELQAQETRKLHQGTLEDRVEMQHGSSSQGTWAMLDSL